MPEQPLTSAVMAKPVIELARSLEERPVVLGISMGGRVALEAGLQAPDAFAGVIAIAPYLPWLRFRIVMQSAWLIDPRIADWLPLERAWPVLRWLAHAFETLPYLRDDELAQAGARLVYYMSCPATRAGLIAAAREMALEPAHVVRVLEPLSRDPGADGVRVGRARPARVVALRARRRTRGARRAQISSRAWDTGSTAHITAASPRQPPGS